MEKRDRIKELVEKLNEASKKYYQEDTEIMSNLEYDALYDELVELEKETGIVMSNSPTAVCRICIGGFRCKSVRSEYWYVADKGL